MSRRSMTAGVLGLVLAVSALVAPSRAFTPSAQAAALNPDLPTLIWGAYARPRTGETHITATQHLEAAAGRSMAATRVYLLWDQTFPDSYVSWLKSTNHLLLISVKAQRVDGTVVPWRSIADAQPGSALQAEIDGWAQRIKDYGTHVYFTFNHEPEAAASGTFGTDQDYKDAWQHVISSFRADQVTNATYMWIMTGYAFGLSATDRRQAVKWYPGDDYVDAMGADEYNDFTCRSTSVAPWKSLATDIEPFRQFGLSHPLKEMWLPEYGSVEDPNVPGRKAQWINDVRAMFKDSAYSQFRGILYFNAQRPGTNNCKWYVDSSDSSLAAFKAMGQDPFYSRLDGMPPPPPPPPPVVKNALFVVGSPTLGTGDAAINNRLDADGYTVTVVDDSVAAATDALGKDVVVISATANSGSVLNKFHDTPTPVMVYKPALYDDMGFTATNAFGTLKSSTIDGLDPADPLAAGFTGTVGVLTTADLMPWGTVGADAHVTATVGGKPALFDYPLGSTLADGKVAAGCRVGFPAYTTSPSKFTAAGKALFDNAISWLDSCS